MLEVKVGYSHTLNPLFKPFYSVYFYSLLLPCISYVYASVPLLCDDMYTGLDSATREFYESSSHVHCVLFGEREGSRRRGFTVGRGALLSPVFVIPDHPFLIVAVYTSPNHAWTGGRGGGGNQQG